MKTVKVKRAFYGDEKGVKAGDVIDVADTRAKELERKGLVVIVGDAKEAEEPDNKQAPTPSDKQAPKPSRKQAKATKSDQEAVASNGLTRREIEADLTAMEIKFDPADKLDDLAALRDLARENRKD